MGKIFEALNKTDSTIKDSESKQIPSEALQVQFGDDYDKNLVTIMRPDSIESEHFKMIRTNIMFPVSGKQPRTMMVTSALPNEGKSFVASNLAVSIAQYLDKYVLLVDCDMRLPTIHKCFGVSGAPGLSEYLSGKIPLSSCFLKTKIDRLTIIPGGSPPHNPSELLSSQKMADLLDEIKSKYPDRFIIIDTAPPKLTSEANVIARQVDGVILVIKYGKTPREIISDIAGRLGKEKILGVILNCFESISITKFKYGGLYGNYEKYYSRRQK